VYLWIIAIAHKPDLVRPKKLVRL